MFGISLSEYIIVKMQNKKQIASTEQWQCNERNNFLNRNTKTVINTRNTAILKNFKRTKTGNSKRGNILMLQLLEMQKCQK